MSQLGGYVKRRRDQRGWSRAELARASGVPYSTLTNIETNKKHVKPTEETLRKLACAIEENSDDTQLRLLAGYDVIKSADASDLAKRIDALLQSSPRWRSALIDIDEMSVDDQNEAVTALEVHAEIVRRRKRARQPG